MLRVAIAIGLVSFVAGLAISLLTTRTGRSPFFQLDRLLKESFAEWELPDPEKADFEDWRQAIFRLDSSAETEDRPADPIAPGRPAPPPAISPTVNCDEAESSFRETVQQIEKGLASSSLPQSERQLLLALLRGLHGNSPEVRSQSRDALREAANAPPPQRHAAEILGQILERSGDRAGAIDAYQLELRHFPGANPTLPPRLADLLRWEERIEELDALMDRPDLRGAFPISDHIDRAITNRDYLKLLGWTLRHDLSVPDPWLALLSVFAGAVWFAIATQFAGRRRDHLGSYAMALALGWLSASITLYVVFIQEQIRGFSHSPDDDTLTQVIYFVAGVSLREETIKLLCFLPLVPFLAKRKSEIDALVCAGLVGLGFAINENIGYVSRGAEFTAWSRFLTANFAHIAWTGVTGLALYRFWRWPKRQWDNLLYDFLIVVAAHGAYDALIVVPAFADYNMVSLIIFALSAYLFLDQAAHLMQPAGSMSVSPLAVFIIGSALLIGITFCFACWAVPFRLALAGFIGSLAGVVPVAFIFINRLRAH